MSSKIPLHSSKSAYFVDSAANRHFYGLSQSFQSRQDTLVRMQVATGFGCLESHTKKVAPLHMIRNFRIFLLFKGCGAIKA